MSMSQIMERLHRRQAKPHAHKYMYRYCSTGLVLQSPDEIDYVRVMCDSEFLWYALLLRCLSMIMLVALANWP